MRTAQSTPFASVFWITPTDCGSDFGPCRKRQLRPKQSSRVNPVIQVNASLRRGGAAVDLMSTRENAAGNADATEQKAATHPAMPSGTRYGHSVPGGGPCEMSSSISGSILRLDEFGERRLGEHTDRVLPLLTHRRQRGAAGAQLVSRCGGGAEELLVQRERLRLRRGPVGKLEVKRRRREFQLYLVGRRVLLEPLVEGRARAFVGHHLAERRRPVDRVEQPRKLDERLPPCLQVVQLVSLLAAAVARAAARRRRRRLRLDRRRDRAAQRVEAAALVGLALRVGEYTDRVAVRAAGIAHGVERERVGEHRAVLPVVGHADTHRLPFLDARHHRAHRRRLRPLPLQEAAVAPHHLVAAVPRQRTHRVVRKHDRQSRRRHLHHDHRLPQRRHHGPERVEPSARRRQRARRRPGRRSSGASDGKRGAAAAARR